MTTGSQSPQIDTQKRIEKNRQTILSPSHHQYRGHTEEVEVWEALRFSEYHVVSYTLFLQSESLLSQSFAQPLITAGGLQKKGKSVDSREPTQKIKVYQPGPL